MNSKKYVSELRLEVEQKTAAIISNGFFQKACSGPQTFLFWKSFVMQKYGTIGYFILLLQNAMSLCIKSSPQLYNVFLENYRDEIGYFSGEARSDYAHETWRLDSLATFGISKENLLCVKSCEEVSKHTQTMVDFSSCSDFLVISGGLLFLEHFVSEEMKALIPLFERDLPELFPKNTYDYSKFPHNKQEYWYSHALHDVYHFRCIEEALESYLRLYCVSGEEKENALLKLRRGIQMVVDAKKLLYSDAVFDFCLNHSS